MDKHYRLIFEENPLHIKNVAKNVPKTCMYPLKSATEVLEYNFPKATLFKQKCCFENFLIESFQLDTTVPFSIGYELLTPRIFFTFVAHNDIEFTTGTGQPIVQVKACHFYLSTELEGIYHVHCKTGRSVVIAVSVHPEWLMKIAKDYPILRTSVQHLLSSDAQFEVLPRCKIDEQVHQWLFDVRKFAHQNSFAEELYLSSCLVMGLEHYETLLNSTTLGKVYHIKQYIAQHYAEPELDLGNLLKKFGLERRTAARQFKNLYGMSMRSYQMWTRLSKAHQLINNEKVPIPKVIEKVGYLNANSFRKAYRKFLAHQREKSSTS